MYLQTYNEQRSEIWTQVISICLLYTIEIPDPETFQKKKKSCSENSKKTCFEEASLEDCLALIPNVKNQISK
jgi:hypothetical protein